MTQDHETSSTANSQIEQPATPDPALKRLEKLVGTWDIKGRTLDSLKDNISGRVIIEWLPGGFFLQQRGEMDIMGVKVYSLEILGYDPATNTFPSHVYSNLDGFAHPYFWDVQDNVVTHWTEGSKYTGTFSEDGNMLLGGWRPDLGVEQNAENTYDATMIRVQ